MAIISATAPAKAILFGEHAVNRGATALAVSVGLYAHCRVDTAGDSLEPGMYRFRGGDCTQTTSRQAILELGQQIDGYRRSERYEAIQALSRADFFAPHKYVLAALDEVLPAGLDIGFSSNIPQSAGLGSGGASFVTLATVLAHLCGLRGNQRQIADWARRGDIVAHGGVASGLDSQTSLYGGAIRYTREHEGEPIPYAANLQLVIGNSRVVAATSEVNGRVRRWLAERPVRMHYFQEIGLLARLAEPALARGDWGELGRLMNLNQLILERIGVSCPELERLNEAALEAGALGAKLSGSGGGGIMIALVTPEIAETVAAAIGGAGGTAILAPVGVAGTTTDVTDSTDCAV